MEWNTSVWNWNEHGIYIMEWKRTAVAITYQFFPCPVKNTVILVAFSHHEVLEEFSQVVVVGCLEEV